MQTKHLYAMIQIRNTVEADTIIPSLSPPVNIFTDLSRASFVDLFFLFMFRICHAFLSVYCSLVVTCWERTNLLDTLYVMFSCVFYHFPMCCSESGVVPDES